jgi:hypothetical protein
MNLDKNGDGKISTGEALGIFLDNERVQQFIAVALTACVVYEVRMGNIDATTLVGVYGTILGFYFKGKT